MATVADTSGSQGKKKPPPKKKPPAKAAPAKSAPVGKAGELSVEQIMAAIRQQESGGNYTAKNPTSTASGAYQYLDSTWNNYGGYKHAWQAPRAVQDARMMADVQRHYRMFGGDWLKVIAAHFAGAGWVQKHPNTSTWGQNPAPGSKNPQVSQYVNAVLRNTGSKSLSVSNTSGGGAGVDATATAFAASSGALPPNASRQQITDYVMANFGYAGAYINHPEIGPLLIKAAQEGWDEARLQGALSRTNFWKHTTATARQWDYLKATDPATANDKVLQQTRAIMAEAKKAGILIGPQRLSKIVHDSLRFGWSGQEITNHLAAEGKFDFTGSKGPNEAMSVLTRLRALAQQFYVPMSDATLQKWAGQVTANQINEQDFQAYLKEQAKSLFPTLAGALDRGLTVDQYTDPYKQHAAQLLEMTPDQIDLVGDPRFNKALFQKDPKTGENTAMSLSSWDTYVRGLPEFAKTRQANQGVAEMAMALQQTFGKVAF